MTDEEYLGAAMRTEKHPDKLEGDAAVTVVHMLFGLSSELGELVAAKDRQNALEEIGDMLWYLHTGMRYQGIPVYTPPCPLPERVWYAEASTSCLLKAIGSLTDLYKRELFYGSPAPVSAVREVVQNILSELAVIIEANNSSFEEVYSMNIEKLRSRYPQKFTEELAATRDLEAEKAALTRGSCGETE